MWSGAELTILSILVTLHRQNRNKDQLSGCVEAATRFPLIKAQLAIWLNITTAGDISEHFII